MMIAKKILYFGHKVILVCDANCEKAWGINLRPRKLISNTDTDNFVYLSDIELDVAPIDPGTYEGVDGKPIGKEDRLNRWCARECERSVMIEDGKDFELPDFGKRHYNQYPHKRD